MDFTNDKKLGFGCMRLPLLNREDNTSFDYEKIEGLFDRYLEKGFQYFDVAYTYHGYHAEEAVKKALTGRYPRNRFQLATKMPLRDFKDEQDLEAIFEEQLRNCGVTFFDFYLLHNMGQNVYQKCCRFHAFDFVQKMKARYSRSGGEMVKVNENTIKLAAAAAMFVDHLGAAAFPEQILFRIVGRLAFPVFAYYIFVGCSRTRDIYRYLARVFFLGLFCMAVFWLFSGEIYGNTLITFSISIYIISTMQEIRKNISETRTQFLAGALVCLAFVLPAAAITRLVVIDYGIWGIYMPVLAELCRVGDWKEQKGMAGFAAGLAGLCISYGGIQYFSLLALPLLLAFRGEKGRFRLPRFFFYYFYPLHFAVVYLTAAALA